MKKKLVSGMMAVTMMTTLLSGCGNSKTDSTGDVPAHQAETGHGPFRLGV